MTPTSLYSQWFRRCACAATAFLLTIAGLAAAQTAPAAPRKLSDAELQSLLDQIEKSLEPVRTMAMDFEQEKHLSLLSDVVKSRGVCFFVRPDTVRFEITEPFQSALIARQRSVAKYERVGKDWRKLDMGSPDMVLMVTTQMSAWLKGRFRAQKDIYEISAVAGEHTTIVMTPRDKQMAKMISSIDLQLSDDRVHVTTVTIREAGGDYTQIRFLNERGDVDIDPALFETAGPAPTPLPPKK
jgi:hypothetical protein